MVNYCVCAGCTNTILTGNRVHCFPNRKRNGASFRAWVRFVQFKRRDFVTSSVTRNAVVCDAHFRQEDYVPGDMMEFRMGYRSLNRVRLMASAVPSIHSTTGSPAAAASPAPGGRGQQRSVREAAQRKRKRKLSTVLGDNEAALAEASASGLVVPKQECLSPVNPKLSVLHRGSQCNIKPRYRSMAVYVSPRMVSVGTQTEMSEIHTSILWPSPAHRDEDPSSVDMKEPGDQSWSPEEENMSEISDGGEVIKVLLQESRGDLNPADKFAVCKAQLMSLFTACPSCCGETQGHIEHQEGTYIRIHQVCAACGYTRLWQNQPVHPVKEKPSYEYAFSLMKSLSESYSGSPQALREASASLTSTAPSPLSSSCQRVIKDEAVVS